MNDLPDAFPENRDLALEMEALLLDAEGIGDAAGVATLYEPLRFTGVTVVTPARDEKWARKHEDRNPHARDVGLDGCGRNIRTYDLQVPSRASGGRLPTPNRPAGSPRTARMPPLPEADRPGAAMTPGRAVPIIGVRESANGGKAVMKMDRGLQLEVLRFCRDAYPANVQLADSPFWEHPDIHANLIYLLELGLISGTLVNGNVEIWNPGITAAGLDFLEDDGGVSSMLRTITVKIDRDDLRSLIAARVEAEDLPPDEKSRLSHAMRSLPEQTLRELTARLVDEAVDQLPGALRLFQTYAGLS